MNGNHQNASAPADKRLSAAQRWLETRTGAHPDTWQAVAGDASYRRYFRVEVEGCSRILMDAPPELEDVRPFVDIARRLHDANLHAPEILHSDPAAGFLLLEDLGDELYRDLLDAESVEPLFREAFDALAVMAREVSPAGLPEYDRGLFERELDWFSQYYLEQERSLRWDSNQRRRWSDFCRLLVDSAMQQPQVFVHKDVHSCNLLRTRHNSPGIIDFQDAVRGPLTYDFVSLIWDRYIAWPRPQLEQWMERFRLLAAPKVPSLTWMRWCDLMGLQRNIKIVGRFALLKHAQGKEGYVEMIPRFYGYLLDTLPRYPEFADLLTLLEDPACAP